MSIENEYCYADIDYPNACPFCDFESYCSDEFIWKESEKLKGCSEIVCCKWCFDDEGVKEMINEELDKEMGEAINKLRGNSK